MERKIIIMTTEKIIKKQSVKRIIDEMVRFNISVEDILEQKNAVASIWEIADLDNFMENSGIIARPALSQTEKLKVLKEAIYNQDSNYGINWKSLDESLRYLYGNRLIEE